MNMIKKIISIVKSIRAVPITIISTYCSLNFPIDRFISFIPSDKAFSVSLTVYSAIFTALLAFLIWGVEYCINYFKTIVKITYSESISQFIEGNELQCSFNMDVCKLFIRIRVTGLTKLISKYKINIEVPKDVYIMKESKYLEYGELLNNDMTFILPISDIVNMNKEYLSEEEFILSLQLIKKREIINSFLETKLVKKNKKIEVINNKVKLIK